MPESGYDAARIILSPTVMYHTGDIIIHAIPDELWTGDCLRGLVRSWSGPSAMVYGGGFHGIIRMSLASGYPVGAAPSLSPPGSAVTANFATIKSGLPALALPYAAPCEPGPAVSVTGMARACIPWRPAGREPSHRECRP